MLANQLAVAYGLLQPSHTLRRQFRVAAIPFDRITFPYKMSSLLRIFPMQTKQHYRAINKIRMCIFESLVAPQTVNCYNNNVITAWQKIVVRRTPTAVSIQTRRASPYSWARRHRGMDHSGSHFASLGNRPRYPSS